jgi:hypothetical protein
MGRGHRGQAKVNKEVAEPFIFRLSLSTAYAYILGATAMGANAKHAATKRILQKYFKKLMLQTSVHLSIA